MGSTTGLRFENITARSENGGLLSAVAGQGISDVVFEGINLTITTGIGNYSSGEGPACCTPGGRENITCMGTRDHRPSYIEDVNCTDFGNCRTLPAKADALRLENAHNVSVEDFTVQFGPKKTSWYGKCLTFDSMSTQVVKTGRYKCMSV